jgi:hypothetical protein
MPLIMRRDNNERRIILVRLRAELRIAIAQPDKSQAQRLLVSRTKFHLQIPLNKRMTKNKLLSMLEIALLNA